MPLMTSKIDSPSRAWALMKTARWPF